MEYLDLFSAFSLGFYLAIILVCRVSMRPSVRKILKDVKVIQKRATKVPSKKEIDWEDSEEL